MKKWWVFALTAAVLAGCGNGEETSDPDEDMEQEETEELTDTDENEADEEDIEEDTEAEEQSEEIEFVLQISDEEAGLSTENDEVLGMIDGLVTESEVDEIGAEDDTLVQYSGLYLTDEQSLLYGVFILSNRTEEAMTNISMNLSLVEGETALFENTPVYLDQEHFGVLEPNTAMPVYVEIDISQLDFVEELSANRQEITYVDDIVFDSPDDNPESRDPEGHMLGYRPEYVAMMAQGENGATQPDENAAELEFVLPDYLEDEESSVAMIQVEQIMDLAAAESVENDISIYWTSVAEQSGDSDEFEAIFLLMNRTGTDFKNIEFGFTLEDENGNVVFDNQTISLPEEEFGVLRDGTMMPVSIPIPEEGRTTFMGILEQYFAMYRFESWDAEED